LSAQGLWDRVVQYHQYETSLFLHGAEMKQLMEAVVTAWHAKISPPPACG